MNRTVTEYTNPAPEDVSALTPLISALEARFHGALRGVFLYGSCLRSGDFFDGLVDLYLVVEGYHRAYENWLLAVGNRLLAPNVFYTEVAIDGKTMRCKFGIISEADIVQATSENHFESYFWGRFAQPMAVVYSHRDKDLQLMKKVLRNARRTFMAKILPALPPRGLVNELWQQGLSLSYSTELRAEGPDRARSIVGTNEIFFKTATEDFASDHGDLLSIVSHGGEYFYESHFDVRKQKRAKFAWALRKVWGKFLSICRLIKGLFTFEGGLDYIAWKLERHSGQKVEIPDKVRRYPLIYCWGLFWKLYRRGVFK